MKLGELGEFGLIDTIHREFSGIDTRGAEGIGDDCAVVPFGEGNSLVVTTDMLVEDVHFLRNAITPYELGRKSLAVNLSDIAAMGAAPYYSLISVSLPRDLDCRWTEDFFRGYRGLSAEFGVALIGGDTTSSTEKIVISITAMGKAKSENIKRRNGAKTGDKIFVTGFLGDSAKGLLDIKKGIADSPFIRIHNNPKPYVQEGEWLGRQASVHAMMDVSDGLASDLPHILKASGLSAEVNLDVIPHNSSVEMAVTGGEDYVLLFTADACRSEKLIRDYATEFGTPLCEIGEIKEGGASITWLEKGIPVDRDWRGFTHF